MSSIDCDLGLVKITEFVDHRFNRFVCSNAKTTMVALPEPVIPFILQNVTTLI